MLRSFQANEVLLMGRKITANEASDRGLVTDVFPDSEFKRKVEKRVTEMASLPPKVREQLFLILCTRVEDF